MKNVYHSRPSRPTPSKLTVPFPSRPFLPASEFEAGFQSIQSHPSPLKTALHDLKRSPELHLTPICDHACSSDRLTTTEDLLLLTIYLWSRWCAARPGVVFRFTTPISSPSQGLTLSMCGNIEVWLLSTHPPGIYLRDTR